MTTWRMMTAVLLVCAFLPIAGCLLEDSISITNDGNVGFEAVVTEPDELKKIEFSSLDKGINSLLDDLRKHKWKVEKKWTSKERPYRLKITGSGKLSDVVGSTSLYTLKKLSDKKYKLSLVPPINTHTRVVFQSGNKSATILDSNEQSVQEIETVSAAESFTITLR